MKDGADYPAVLFLTGANDGRVDPMNSRKMTARLQAAQHADRPILLRTSSNSGHGFGTRAGRENRSGRGRVRIPVRSVGNQIDLCSPSATSLGRTKS